VIRVGNCKEKLGRPRAPARRATRSLGVLLVSTVLAALSGCRPRPPGPSPAPVHLAQEPQAAEAPENGSTPGREDVQDGPSAWLAREARPETFDAALLEREIVRLTNRLRRQQGRPALRGNAALTKTARSHSLEMARLDYFSHRSPTPERRSAQDRLAKSGLGFRVLAENIAKEPRVARFWSDGRLEWFTWGDVAANAVRHWCESPGHRANLLRRDVTETGVGAARSTRDGRPYVYLTQDFRAPPMDPVP
jgi:uncharacterized protein YkwD